MTVVRVVGASGRVGSAIAAHLGQRWSVETVDRRSEEALPQLVNRAANGARIIVNAAGVAHVTRDDPSVRSRLQAANVDLPSALADAALRAGAAFVHISSVKAESPGDSPYAASKRAGDDALEALGPAYEAAGLTIVTIRPLALLFPPLDAGKVRHLRLLGHVPPRLVPGIRLAVLAPATFLRTVELTVEDVLEGRAPTGFRIRRFEREDRGTLRDIARSFAS